MCGIAPCQRFKWSSASSHLVARNNTMQFELVTLALEISLKNVHIIMLNVKNQNANNHLE